MSEPIDLGVLDLLVEFSERGADPDDVAIVVALHGTGNGRLGLTR